jgi:hypothetical protein
LQHLGSSREVYHKGFERQAFNTLRLPTLLLVGSAGIARCLISVVIKVQSGRSLFEDRAYI